MVGPQTHTVDIAIGSGGMGCEEDNTCFLPYEVVVNAGDTVLWDNIDDVLHTVNSRDEGLFDSDLISAGDTFDVVFEEPGTFDYICIVHPWMLGTVTRGIADRATSRYLAGLHLLDRRDAPRSWRRGIRAPRILPAAPRARPL